jgi:hypothetical protein
MIKRVLGWLKRQQVFLRLGAVLLMLGTIGAFIQVFGGLRPQRYDLCVPLEELLPKPFDPWTSRVSVDGSRVWIIYQTRNQETRILRCDRKTRTVVRDERPLAAIEAEAGRGGCLDYSNLLPLGEPRLLASISGLPYFRVVILPNYFTPDPVSVFLLRTVNGRIRWNLALKGGDVTVATQFAWGVPVALDRPLRTYDIASNADGSVVSVWDAKAGRIYLLFNDQDYRK